MEIDTKRYTYVSLPDIVLCNWYVFVSSRTFCYVLAPQHFQIKANPNFKNHMIIFFTWAKGNISAIRESEEIGNKNMAKR